MPAPVEAYAVKPLPLYFVFVQGFTKAQWAYDLTNVSSCLYFFFSDVSHKMDVGLHDWYLPASCTKVHCHQRAVVFQAKFFFCLSVK